MYSRCNPWNKKNKILFLSLSFSLFIYFSLPSPQSVYTRVSAKFNFTTAKHLQVYRARSRSHKYWKYLAKLHFNWMQIKFAPLTSEASHLKMFCGATHSSFLLFFSSFSPPRIVAFCSWLRYDFGKRGDRRWRIIWFQDECETCDDEIIVFEYI